MTKIAPPKIKIDDSFLIIGTSAFSNICIYLCQSGRLGKRRQSELTGIGIDSRYRSENTFKTTVTYKSIFEIAGWQ